jgi:hypothetical protein
MCPVFSSRFGQAYEGVDTRWMCVVFVVEPAPFRLCQQSRGPPHHDQSVPPTASTAGRHISCISRRMFIPQSHHRLGQSYRIHAVEQPPILHPNLHLCSLIPIQPYSRSTLYLDLSSFHHRNPSLHLNSQAFLDSMIGSSVDMRNPGG